jgi:hypothetical protein
VDNWYLIWFHAVMDASLPVQSPSTRIGTMLVFSSSGFNSALTPGSFHCDKELRSG